MQFGIRSDIGACISGLLNTLNSEQNPNEEPTLCSQDL